MPKSNIHILTDEEREYFNSKYSFDVKDDSVLVSIKDYDRTTAHPLNQSFALKTILRKLTISVEALSLWANFFHKKYRADNSNEDLYSLIDVQNAVNILTVSYQSVSYASVFDTLKKQNK